MDSSELLPFCLEYYEVRDSGLYFKKWRRGLPSDIIGKRAGNSHHSGYKYLKIKNKLYAEHRIVWLMVYGEFPSGELDHKDLDKENNSIDNLRESDRGGNCSNRDGWGASGYKGVTANKRGKPWLAYIRKDGRVKRLGNFDCPVEAARAYDREALKLHGEFAKTNFNKEDYV